MIASRRTLSTAAALLLIGVAAMAQNAIKVQVQNIVAEGEQFTVSFIIESGENGRPEGFSWDCGDDFQKVWGPQTGTSTSTSIYNGKVSTSSQYTYSYILMARSVGKFTLPAASATIGGKLISSAPKQIEVVRDEDASAGESSSQSQAKSPQQQYDVSSRDLFMRLSLSRSEAVVGESITATLKLYQKVDISGVDDIKFPSFKGFWSQTLETPTNINFQREVLGDKIYNSAVLRSWVLVPQQKGELTIEPAELTCLVNIRVQSRSNSIMDLFFDDNVRSVRKRLFTPEVRIRVSELPQGAPESFSGGVGRFSLKASVSRDSLKAHDAGSLTVTISGNGNVSLLEAPKVTLPPDFEAYDVKVNENTSSGGTSGSKTFEFPFIPRSHGSFEIPPVKWSYYDIGKGKYVTLESDPIRVEVAPAENSLSAGTPSGGLRLPEKNGVKTLSEDIRYIRTAVPSLSKGSRMLSDGAAYPALLIIMVLGTAGYYLLSLRSSRRRADVAGMRGRRAAKMAMKRLARSKEYLDKGLDSAFYEELHKSLLGFAADKFNLSQEELGREGISLRLKGSGVPEDAADEFASLVEACEFARYSPAAGDSALREHYDKAVKLISMLESTIKKGRNTSRATMAIALLLSFGAAGHANAAGQSADSLWRAGTEAYADGRFQEAAAAWSKLQQEGWQGATLSYNLGNALFKTGNLSGAILSYERALKADPSLADARNNLEYANSLVQDRIETVPEFLLKSWARSLCYSLGPNTWAVLSLLLFAAFCLLVLAFLLQGTPSGRKKGFFGALAALALFGLTCGFALWQKNDFKASDKAIVTAPVVSVRNSPTGSSAKDLFVLHEGTKVRVKDKVGDYCDIVISDGRQGWVRSSEIEVI